MNSKIIPGVHVLLGSDSESQADESIFNQIQKAKPINWNQWELWTRRHIWEGIVAQEVLNLALVETDLFTKMLGFKIDGEVKAQALDLARAILEGEIHAGTLPPDFWERWDLVLKQDHSQLSITVDKI